MRVKKRKKILEVNYRFTLNGGHQGVGKTAHSEPEKFPVQPFGTQNSLDDGIITDGVFSGGNASSGLESDFTTGLGIESLYAFAHYKGGHRSGVDADLSGGCLDEISSFFHGEEGGGRDTLRSHQKTGLKDHLQDHFPA